MSMNCLSHFSIVFYQQVFSGRALLSITRNCLFSCRCIVTYAASSFQIQNNKKGLKLFPRLGKINLKPLSNKALANLLKKLDKKAPKRAFFMEGKKILKVI